MKRTLPSPLALALILTLNPAAVTFGQAAPSRDQNSAAERALGHRLLKEAPAQQGNKPWNSGSNLFWRNVLVDPSSQGYTFTWIDAASRNSGMTLAPADSALRAHLDLPKDEGLIVTALEAGSPAFVAGIRQNDVLIRLGDGSQKTTPLGKPQDLEAGLKAAGDQPTTLVILRGGKKLSLKVQPQVKVSLGPIHPEPSTYWIGVSVTPIEPALRSQLELPDKQGLIAMEVVKDGPAAKAGVRQYDILLKFDGVDLMDQASLTRLVQARGEKTMALELFRAGHKQEIRITPERRKASVTFRAPGPRTGQWEVDIVHPGAVVAGQDARLGHITDILTDQGDLIVANQSLQEPEGSGNIVGTAKTPGGKSTEQRLDELTAQIKELRRAIEALSKAPGKQ